MSTEHETPRQQVIDKMWYSFLLWGRLSYDPTLPNNQFQAFLGEEFPQVAGANLTNLFTGWATVSKIFPLLTRFFWGDLDLQWYPEACWSSSGFETVQNFITPRWDPMQSSQDGDRPLLMSVKEFVDGAKPDGRMTPEQVADQLQQFAERALVNIPPLLSDDEIHEMVTRPAAASGLIFEDGLVDVFLEDVRATDQSGRFLVLLYA